MPTFTSALTIREKLWADWNSKLRGSAFAGRVLNPEAALADLRRNGIPVVGESRQQQEGQKLARRFLVPVYDLDALGIWSNGQLNAASRHSQFREIPEDSRSMPMRGAMRTAVRAVYSLGLDFGVVELGVAEDGGMAVLQVRPLPPHNRRIEQLYAEAEERHRAALEHEADRRTPALLGMDPEFVLKQPGPDGRIVPASRYLVKRGPVGCDGIRIGGRLYYPLAELRPEPAVEVPELVRSLRRTMRIASSRISDRDLEWLAGGMPAKGLPLGGHIHMSGIYLHARLLRALDHYMALPLVMIEDATTGRRRKRYGQLGDFRRQFHGGFEYRTLPSWIVTPQLAAGVLALARLIADHHTQLSCRALDNPHMQTLYYEGRKQELAPLVDQLWRELSRLPGYSALARYLEPLRSRIERLEPWDESRDIRPYWKIAPYDR